MDWNRGVAEPKVLQNLGLLVARLGRIFLYQKIARTDALLKTHGIDSELSKAYREHVYNEIERSEELLKPNQVEWISGRHDF